MLLFPELRILSVGVMLLYASISDWRLREVSDRLWVVFGAAGLGINAVNYLLGLSIPEIATVLISIAATTVVAVSFYYIRMYGGADAKALIVISILLPVYMPPSGIHSLTAIIVLTNGTLISLVVPGSFSVYNLLRILSGDKIFEGFAHETTLRKFFASFMGFRVRDASKRRFLWAMEKKVNDKRRFEFSLLKDEPPMVTGEAWVTPGIPLIIFLSAGFLAVFLVGDIIAAFFFYVLG